MHIDVTESHPGDGAWQVLCICMPNAEKSVGNAEKSADNAEKSVGNAEKSAENAEESAANAEDFAGMRKNPREVRKNPREMRKNPREMRKNPREVRKNPREARKNPREVRKNPREMRKKWLTWWKSLRQSQIDHADSGPGALCMKKCAFKYAFQMCVSAWDPLKSLAFTYERAKTAYEKSLRKRKKWRFLETPHAKTASPKLRFCVPYKTRVFALTRFRMLRLFCLVLACP